MKWQAAHMTFATFVKLSWWRNTKKLNESFHLYENFQITYFREQTLNGLNCFERRFFKIFSSGFSIFFGLL